MKRNVGIAIATGVAVGTALGAAFGQIGAWIAVGAGLGLLVPSLMSKNSSGCGEDAGKSSEVKG